MPSSLVLNLVQILVVLAGAPLLKGTIQRLDHVIQGKRGPSVLQPYYDLGKWLRKEEVASSEASWLFRLAPYVVFASPLVVVMLIPVLTSFPLYWAFMGDMMGGGFLLALGGFFVHMAALDTGSPYGGVGSSRSRFVSLLSEPVLILVFFSVSYIAQATIPYVVNKTLASPSVILSPSHVLLMIAFFMVILAEGGHIPVDNPASHHELSQIEKSRLVEMSGPGLALMEWGSMMKTMVLATILMNVLVTPFGLAATASPGPLLLAIIALAAKMAVFAVAVAIIETSLAKLRLLRIAEFLGAAFVVSLFAVVMYTLGV